MATYNKKLKIIEVHFMLDSTPITVADTADNDIATRALNEFKNYGTAHIVANGATQAVPFHTVQYVKVTETDGEITKADAYGCE